MFLPTQKGKKLLSRLETFSRRFPLLSHISKFQKIVEALESQEASPEDVMDTEQDRTIENEATDQALADETLRAVEALNFDLDNDSSINDVTQEPGKHPGIQETTDKEISMQVQPLDNDKFSEKAPLSFNPELAKQSDIGDLESYLFQSKCMKQLFKLRPGNKFIVIGGTAGMRELAEKDPEKVNFILLTGFNHQFGNYESRFFTILFTI